MDSLKMFLCRLLRVLLPLYALFLLFLGGREVLAGTQPPPESVYFWKIAGQGGIYTVPATDRGTPAPVSFAAANRQGCVGCHVVSSAANRVAFSVGGGTGSLRILTMDGRNVPAPSIRSSYFSWSPDGERLVYADQDRDIYILDIESQTTSPVLGANVPAVVETMPSWSPDNSTIAFVRCATADDGFSPNGQCDIYTVPVTGGTAKPLLGASGSGLSYYPAYSPDDKWLAFTRHTAGSTTYADPYAEIFLVPAQGGAAKRLAANDDENGQPLTKVSNSWPVWSRDGQWLAFNSKRRGDQFDIFVTSIDADGNSGVATPLPGASDPAVFEHLPYWGKGLPPAPLLERLGALWPWLLPLLLALLLPFLCQEGRAGLGSSPFVPEGHLPSGARGTISDRKQPGKAAGGGGFRPEEEERPQTGSGGFRPREEEKRQPGSGGFRPPES